MPFPKSDVRAVVGVGSLVRAKRWDILVEAVADLREEGIDVNLRIAGEGEARSRLEEQIRSRGIGGHAVLIGQADDVASVLGTCSFLVHTSEFEGCPNAVMEAMACGRPVISFAVGEVPFLVEDGITGYVIKQGDIKQLRKRMADLASDPMLCRQMGEAARKKAEREFDLQRFLAQTLQAYREAGWVDNQTAMA
jgi:glycosyltransferase involved in cell wall biosynthesis